MRKKIVAGNWKMNLSLNQACELYKNIVEQNLVLHLKNTEIVLFVPFTHISTIKNIHNEIIHLGAQNCSQFNNGAYTGEISGEMLSDIKIKYCIIGHSERRQYFGETNEILNQKLFQCYKHGINPYYCCGETLEDRKSNNHFQVIESQIMEGLKNVSIENIKNTVIAYEPVWAIGTGETATPEEAQEIHMFIRKLIKKLYNQEIADEIHILYGGSVNSKNAGDLFKQPDIDGGLVGGASLKLHEFQSIILTTV